MRHMRLHQMARGQGRAQAELTRQHACGNDAGELARVVAGVGGMRASHAEQVEHGGLGLEDGAAADGADFDRGHADGDLEVAV
jgi:hypothetical protein